MKKSLYLLPFFLIFPTIVFAAVGYSRSSENSSIYSPVTIDITVSDYDKDINCGGLQFWGVQAIEHSAIGRIFPGEPRFVPASRLSQKFIINLPSSAYEEITFVCSDNGEDEAFQFGSIENDLAGDRVIFSVSMPVIESDQNYEL